MNGWPVWLASISFRDARGTMPTEKWPRKMRSLAQVMLARVLEGVGDQSRERSFRMCVTICRHRALTEDEHRGLPEWWHRDPAIHLAGGPIEVLWERGIGKCLSTRPCRAPGKQWIGDGLYFPSDCGRCDTCRAREDARRGGAHRREEEQKW